MMDTVSQSVETDQLFAAMVDAQSRVRDAGKDRTNPQLRNNYATLESVLDAIREPFNAAGLALYQSPGVVVDGMVHVTTQIVHKSGQYIRSAASCPLVGYKGSGADENRGINVAQAFGIVVSYLRRYALMAVAGIVGTDDDTDGDMSGRRPDDRGGRDNDRRDPPRDDRRDEPRQEQRPAERREVDAAKTGGQTFDFGKAADAFAALQPPWSKDDIAKTLGVRDFFGADGGAVRALYAKAKDGDVHPPSIRPATTRQQAQEMP